MTGNLCRMPTFKFQPSSKGGFPYKSLWIEKGPGERVSMGLTVRRKTAKNLAVRRKNERILAVSRKKN